MNCSLYKPHLIFLPSIPIILTYGALLGNEVWDLNIYDTYYVIRYTDLSYMLSFLFGCIGLGYWIMEKYNKKLSTWLSIIHTALSIGGILLVMFLAQFYRGPIREYEFNSLLSSLISVICFIIILAQVIFPINILYGLTKNKNHNSS
ncbi:hypothetical protein EHW67_14010 [Arenibacter aquaticus]|uniref:Uncharacterized protein n=1 Tax=Arenibacter aquaticus TaxID=2489054 RepID=A0A430K124_9FLAO|nr:hypothetical protein [Arenibacter aquaticus]RTE52783.1 hypothetical protein EHW67_14010 [Arenibacter aquaticus]